MECCVLPVGEICFAKGPVICYRQAVWIWGYIIGYLFEKAVDHVAPGPLAADGKQVDATWEYEPESGLQLTLHRAELEKEQLRAFLPRLGRCFDHGLEDSQIEILLHRIGRLTVKKGFHGYYSVVQRQQVTNLEIMIEHQLCGTYILALRGMGPAMDVVRQELDRFQAPVATAPAASFVPTPPQTRAAEIVADGTLRLTADRRAWLARLPMEQGHVLGHPIEVMVENKRLEADIQPQQADHQLLMQVFAQLPQITGQVVQWLVERVEDPESLRSLCEPVIFLAAERVDPQAWSFVLTQKLPQPAKLTLAFRGTQLLR